MEKCSIVIAMTTHNRLEVAQKSVKEWKKYLPKNARFFIVDDGSTVPFPKADFRFETAQGIASAKNKSIELCMATGADHIILIDDDIYPITKNWWQPYVESTVDHLCYTFDSHTNGASNGRIKLREDDKYSYWESPCGLMLYLTKTCIETVGGMDPEYGIWGMEHVGFSMRIHNNGLTPHPFMDVVGSDKLFYSFDRDLAAPRSVDETTRWMSLGANTLKYNREIASKAYIPYKALRDVVITTFFVGFPDPQRPGQVVHPDIKAIEDLVDSVQKACDADIVVLTDFADGFEGNVNYIKIGTPVTNTPYWERWFQVAKHLFDHKYNNIWIVDGFDVVMLKNPFPEMISGKLYVGDERGETLSNQWIQGSHPQEKYQRMYALGRNYPLLNAGIVGGDYETVSRFVNMMVAHYRFENGNMGNTDMAGFNFVCYAEFDEYLIYGEQVCTVFKADEFVFNYPRVPYFKHK